MLMTSDRAKSPSSVNIMQKYKQISLILYNVQNAIVSVKQ